MMWDLENSFIIAVLCVMVDKMPRMKATKTNSEQSLEDMITLYISGLQMATQ